MFVYFYGSKNRKPSLPFDRSNIRKRKCLRGIGYDTDSAPREPLRLGRLRANVNQLNAVGQRTNFVFLLNVSRDVPNGAPVPAAFIYTLLVPTRRRRFCTRFTAALASRRAPSARLRLPAVSAVAFYFLEVARRYVQQHQHVPQKLRVHSDVFRTVITRRIVVHRHATVSSAVKYFAGRINNIKYSVIPFMFA